MQEYPTIEQPRFLDIPLYEHQKTTVFRMMELERTKTISNPEVLGEQELKTHFGILGDEPGYGKTLSVCTLIALGKMKPTDKEIQRSLHTQSSYNLGPLVVVKDKRVENGIRSRFINATLVVCSSSIMLQWEKTLKMPKGRIRLVKLVTKKDIQNFVETLDKNRDTKKEVVFLCGHTLYNFLARVCSGLVWKRFVFDEPASVKIPSMVGWSACFSWFVTATYHMFYDRHNFVTRSKNSYLKQIFLPLGPVVIDSLVVANPREYILASQDLPPPLEIKHRCFGNAFGGALSAFVSPEILEMMEAGNISGAISSLGGDAEEKNVFEAARQKYERRLEKARGKIAEYTRHRTSKKEAKRALLEKWEGVEEEMQQKIAELEERLQEALRTDCPICASELAEPVLSPCCQHIFCGACICSWLSREGRASDSCPMCRVNIGIASLIPLVKDGEEKKKGKEKMEEEQQDNREMTKMEHIEELVKNAEKKGMSILIFSSHEDTFRGLKNLLDTSRINYRMVKGQKSVKEKIIAAYMAGEIRVLLMNATHNASGIDLQRTTDVVLMHSVEEHIKRQVVGRAQRLGRKGRVRVHTFVE
ncbi:zinc finger protein [Cannes 8 virus]|uniref:Zinc finger protein n=1 Tax=Marseillevirus marseillevirus TaxID=694581 RepID=D2XB38_GBMV|nr:zinc finger protein [Marseillevirus marseillevirus]YP_009094860.1 conserved putative helicase [Melbournevirus]ADB04165.1 zinc finger protein [Marseillevirus marseillevirus]AGV01776.1 zinc finger protein [Cannes 8 virus]AIT54972.1 helicase [Melbournevirus]